MAMIKKDRYKIRFKAYITYPYEEKITGIFLEEHYDTISRIKLEDNSLDTTISKELANFIVSEGGKVEKIKVLRFRGKKKLFDIPVEIKNRNNELVIRLVGKTKEELSKNIEEIKKKLLKSGVKHTKVCSWRRLEDFDEGTDDEYLENAEDNIILEAHHLKKYEKEDTTDRIVEIVKADNEVNKDNIDKENVVCPFCDSDNIKELLQTPNGNRMKCLDCNEMFVDNKKI